MVKRLIIVNYEMVRRGLSSPTGLNLISPVLSPALTSLHWGSHDNQAEQSSSLAANRSATPYTTESDIEDVIVPNTPRPAGELQGGTTIALAIRTPERLQGPPELIPTLASEPYGTPEAQVELPASTAPARMEQSPRKRRRVANKLYRDSWYEL